MQQGPVGRGYRPGVGRYSLNDTRGAMRANTSRLLASLDKTVDEVGEFTDKKFQEVKDAEVGAEQIEAAIAMYGDESGYLGSLLGKVKDPERSAGERAALARSVSDIIGMQVGETRYQDQRDIAKRRIAIREADAAQRWEDRAFRMAERIAAQNAADQAAASADRLIDFQINTAFPDIVADLYAMGENAPVNGAEFAYNVNAALEAGDKQAAAGMINVVSQQLAVPKSTYQLTTLDTPAGKTGVVFDPSTGDTRLAGVRIPGVVGAEDVAGGPIGPDGSPGVLPAIGGPDPKKELELKKLQGDVQAQEDKRRKDIVGIKANVDAMDNYVALIDELIDHPGLPGAVGARMPFQTKLPTKAAEAQTMIDRLKGAAFVKGIQEMKASGGAGSISDAEGAKMEAASARLNPNLTEKDFIKALKEFRAEMLQIKAGKESLLQGQDIPATPSEPTETDKLRIMITEE